MVLSLLWKVRQSLAKRKSTRQVGGCASGWLCNPVNSWGAKRGTGSSASTWGKGLAQDAQTTTTMVVKGPEQSIRGQISREEPTHGDAKVGEDRIAHEVVGLRTQLRASIRGGDRHRAPDGT